MKTKEEIETSITRSLIETSKPEMLKYVTSVPYGFNKPNYEAMSLMVYGYSQCQEDNKPFFTEDTWNTMCSRIDELQSELSKKKYTEEDMKKCFYHNCIDNPKTMFEDYLKEYVELKKCDKIISEWQLCPMCLGEGRIANVGTSSSMYRICPVCNGNRTLIKPII
jgi:hypothetical protein